MAFGLLNIDKPSGMTSHDVVARVRRWTGEKRVGHAGTLDPMATGILVLCLGAATRLSEYIMGIPKTYQATIRLGQTTDTYDAEGQILSENETPISRAEFKVILPRFEGAIDQVPPMYSAIKQGGEKLYEKARRGEEVERDPRAVTIYNIELEEFAYPQARITVRCSSGTYIRSLAHDIGAALGVGAHVSALRREKIGKNFTLTGAIPLAQFAELVQQNRWKSYLMDVSLGLDRLPRIELNNQPESVVRNGGFIRLGISNTGPIQAWSDEGVFIGILVPHGEEEGETIWKPEKIFNLQEEEET